MLDINVQTQLMCNLFNQITGRLYIVAEQNTPRPTIAYGTVKVVTVIDQGWDELSLVDNPADPPLEDDEDMIETITGMRSLFCSVNFIKDNPMTEGKKLVRSFQASRNRELLYTNGLGLTEHSEVRDLTEIVGAEFEPRAQADISFNVVDEEIFFVNAINSVEINTNFQTNGNEYNNTIEVSE